MCTVFQYFVQHLVFCHNQIQAEIMEQNRTYVLVFFSKNITSENAKNFFKFHVIFVAFWFIMFEMCGRRRARGLFKYFLAKRRVNSLRNEKNYSYFSGSVHKVVGLFSLQFYFFKYFGTKFYPFSQNLLFLSKILLFLIKRSAKFENPVSAYLHIEILMASEKFYLIAI